MMKKKFVYILINLCVICMLSPAFSQELQRVRTADTIPGWGTPLAGQQIFMEYRIVPGDEILISAWQNDDLTRLVTVKGDGKISYPLIGSIHAVGLTVDELRDSLEEALVPYTRSTTGNVIEADDEIEIFLWRNQALSRTTKIRMDGKITYPLIGTIQAAGLTTEELQHKIKEGFSKYIRPPVENIIEPDDEIEVFVWKHVDLSRVVRVRGDGKITYPLIGTIQAAGLNIDQLQGRMKDELSQYIKFPDVTVLIRKKVEEEGLGPRDAEDVIVFIKSYSDDKISKIADITVEVVKSAGSKVIVFGEVSNEGIYLYKGTITLIEAIAMAGGVSTTGKRESIIVVSGNMTENPEVRRINLFRILREGTSERDILLKPNDVIYVPRTFIADLNRFYTDIQPTLDKGLSVFDWRDKLMTWYKHWDRGMEK